MLTAGFTIAGTILSKFKGMASTKLNDHTITGDDDSMPVKSSGNPNIGAFSVSLNVKDLQVSKQFYENLGFTVFGGSVGQQYLIMKNGHALIGLFHGMFEKTILTFNPGWDDSAAKIDQFDDVRVIQKRLKQKGISLLSEADEQSTGPASLMMLDPDGNQILLDQHV